MDLIQEGLKRDLIQFDSKGKYVSYPRQQKRRNFEDPEEKVQTDTYLKLVLVYGYPPERVGHFVPVQMGSEKREADLIVYEDDLLKSPLIVVECKKPEVSELEFARAVDQAFSYAVAEGAKYVWVTSSLKNEYYEVTSEKPKNRLAIPDVPQFGVKELAKYKFAHGGGKHKQGKNFLICRKSQRMN